MDMKNTNGDVTARFMGAAGLTAAAAAPFLTSCCAAPDANMTAADECPNIIVIMVDDMGYSDIGCYGAEIQTPNIDRLANNGMRFTQFYTNPVCTPTRASLLSGRYSHQAGLGTNNTWPRYKPGEIPVDKSTFWCEKQYPAYHTFRINEFATLGEAVKHAGYQTFMTGKWHVGDEEKYWPYNTGFDRSFAMIWGAGWHFAPTGVPYTLDGKHFTDFPEDFYSTDYFFKYAIDFIEDSDPDKPYFLYLAPSAPHSPFQAWPEDIKKYDGVYDKGWEYTRRKRFEKQKEMGLYPKDLELTPRIPSHKSWEEVENKDAAAYLMQVYAAMVDRIDQRIGDLIEVLEERGELDNTVIFFFSDNGGTMLYGEVDGENHVFHPWCETRGTPLSKMKGWVHEGGIRSPFVVHWPHTVPAGTINRDYAGHVMDMIPTCLDIAKAGYPESYGKPSKILEGRSLLPAMTNPEYSRDRTLFWEFAGGKAVRDGDWKLVREFTDMYFGRGDATEPDGEWALYNVRTDPGENRNLIKEYPAKVEDLRKKWEEWADDVGVIPRQQLYRERREYRQAKQNR